MLIINYYLAKKENCSSLSLLKNPWDQRKYKERLQSTKNHCASKVTGNYFSVVTAMLPLSMFLNIYLTDLTTKCGIGGGHEDQYLDTLLCA
jgi:hypothetical protein